jgi:translation initiation factor 2B subunit (eIF-2B alpha/beta/delta family)
VSFQDALAVADSLCNTGYSLMLIPDACIGHLIARNQIDKILIGAHAIHVFEGKPIWFVNTCGTSQLIDSAIRYNIPIFIVAESSKIVDMANADDLPFASYEEEEDVFEDVLSSVSDLKASGMKIGTMNIGYDLCKFHTGIYLLTEEGLCGE